MASRRAFVLGAGQIGLLSTLVLRLKGLEGIHSRTRQGPEPKAEIVAGMEAKYISTSETPLEKLAEQVGRADLIIDATGNSQISFDAMKVLGHNGVLVWTSITGGTKQHTLPSDKINIEWVLGNKLLVGSVNANRTHFESGIKDLALGEMMYPGVLQKILTIQSMA